MIAKGQVEKRTLKAHANLIYTTIMRQAGTQEKAILEGVMNAIDARATKCEIEVTPSKIIIRDDGKGFQQVSELMQSAVSILLASHGRAHVAGRVFVNHQEYTYTIHPRPASA